MLFSNHCVQIIVLLSENAENATSCESIKNRKEVQNPEYFWSEFLTGTL